jgi:hypothetical protein
LGLGVNTLGRYELGTNDVPMGVAEQMAVLYGVLFDEIRIAVAETRAALLEEAAKHANSGRSDSYDGQAMGRDVVDDG